MPKNIVVCCDGTGNEFGDSNSNVVKLASTLVIDEHQVSYYHPGVGTMGAPNARNWVEKKWDVIRGLAFGYGVTFCIADAYHYLIQTYEPGDQIYLFGFSRGAYTARALGGLLDMYGLLHKGNEGLIPYITEKFATRTKETQGMAHTLEVAEGFKQTFCQDVQIHFVGVWDTVSSVGWISDPVVIPFTATNPIMEIGRHAVSIDERRCFFRDNLWGKPFQPGEPGFRVHQDIKQVWFAGVHSDVGGSYPEGESGLSKITLEWMLHEAKLAGLRIHDDEAKRVLGVASPAPFVRPDPSDGQHESLKDAWWVVEFLPHFKYDKMKGRPHWTLPPIGKRRRLPIDPVTHHNLAVLHESVFDRMQNVPEYRPENLLGTDYPREKYVPLFSEAPGYLKSPDGSLASLQPDERRFDGLGPVGRVQAILDFKVDANPLLQCPPDMWPGIRDLRRSADGRGNIAYPTSRRAFVLDPGRNRGFLAAASRLPQAVPDGADHALQATPRRARLVDSIGTAEGAATVHQWPLEGGLPVSRRIGCGRCSAVLGLPAALGFRSLVGSLRGPAAARRWSASDHGNEGESSGLQCRARRVG